MAPGTVPAKYKELVAVAVALTTQCSYCIQVHVGRAREAGAGDAELAEIAAVVAAIRAGGAITHATHLFYLAVFCFCKASPLADWPFCFTG